MSALLELRGVVKRFGGVAAVDGVTMEVAPQTIHGLIGPNGSGKTTLLGVVSGTHRADGGTVFLDGDRLRSRRAHRFVRAGVARTFQTTRLFRFWSLAENLRVALEERGASDLELDDVLDVVGLDERRRVPVDGLTNSEQRLAMVAMALATGPRLLLLDEPAVGMSEDEAQQLARAIRRARDDLGITVLVVEHNMHFLMGLAERVTVMNAGAVLAEGTPAEIRSNADVIATYLGS